jgi:hypothetical protein
VFSLCDGKFSRKAGVMKRYTLADAIKWNHLRSYDNHVTEEHMKKQSKQRG